MSAEFPTKAACMNYCSPGGDRRRVFECSIIMCDFVPLQVVNPSFPNPRRRLRLRDLAERVIDAQENEQELNKLLNEALLERETVQA